MKAIDYMGMTGQEVIYTKALEKLVLKIKALGWKLNNNHEANGIYDNGDECIVFYDRIGQNHFLRITKDGIPYFPPCGMICI